MRTLIALAIMLCTSTSAAWAAVEGQVAGNWKTASGAVLQIQADGSYSKLTEGRVVETGNITALDGKWNLRSSTGKLDSGTFSIMGGTLTLRSSVAGTTSWSRTTASASSPLQTGVTVNSQLPNTINTSSGLAGNNYYPAPVPVPIESRTRRSVKGGLKSLAEVVQQAATEGYNSGAFTNNAGRRFANETSLREINATINGARKLNFSQPRQQNQGAPDPFLMKGGSFRDPGDGHGTYSAMKKNWEQKQISSLPPAKPIQTASDETLLYGVPAFEKRALGPAVPYRIKFLGLE